MSGKNKSKNGRQRGTHKQNIVFLHQVDFGSVLNDTEHVKTVKVTNISPLDAYYTWSFTHHGICFEGKEDDEGIIVSLPYIWINFQCSRYRSL